MHTKVVLWKIMWRKKSDKWQVKNDEAGNLANESHLVKLAHLKGEKNYLWSLHSLISADWLFSECLVRFLVWPVCSSDSDYSIIYLVEGSSKVAGWRQNSQLRKRGNRCQAHRAWHHRGGGFACRCEMWWCWNSPRSAKTRMPTLHEHHEDHRGKKVINQVYTVLMFWLLNRLSTCPIANMTVAAIAPENTLQSPSKTGTSVRPLALFAKNPKDWPMTMT